MGTNNGMDLIMKSHIRHKKNLLPPTKDGKKPLNTEQIRRIYTMSLIAID
jgi:hypothetical protein